jgi:hypothetical protein
MQHGAAARHQSAGDWLRANRHRSLSQNALSKTSFEPLNLNRQKSKIFGHFRLRDDLAG